MSRHDEHASDCCRHFLPLENSGSRQEFVEDVAVHISQAIVASLEAIGKAAVVHAELVQESRVQVVDVHGITDNIEAEVVSLPVDCAGANTAAGEPHGKAASVMITSVIGSSRVALTVGCATEFTTPNY